MASLNELRQKRAGIIADARKFYDERKASGSWTSADEAKFESIMGDADKIGKQIEAEERLDGYEADLRELAPGQHPPEKPLGEKRAATRSEIVGDDVLVADSPKAELRTQYRGVDPTTDPRCPRSVGELVVAKLKGEARAALAGNDTTGGFLVAPKLAAEFLDLSRARSVLTAAGARTVMFTGDGDSLSFARLDSDPVPHWRPESVEVPLSTATFGRINSYPRVVATYCEMSEELALSARNAQSVITSAMASATALAWDKAGLIGEGSNEPTGIAYLDEVPKVDLNQSLTAADIIDFGLRPLAENGPGPESLTWIETPALTTSRLQLTDGDGTFLRLPGPVEAMRKMTSNQLRSDRGNGSQSEIIVGDFSQVAVIVKSPMRIEIARGGDSFRKLMVQIRSWVMLDVVCLRPNHFVYIDRVGV